jgi:hypothetical protein
MAQLEEHVEQACGEWVHPNQRLGNSFSVELAQLRDNESPFHAGYRDADGRSPSRPARQQSQLSMLSGMSCEGRHTETALGRGATQGPLAPRHRREGAGKQTRCVSWVPVFWIPAFRGPIPQDSGAPRGRPLLLPPGRTRMETATPDDTRATTAAS